MKRVVVTGMGMVSPLGSNLSLNWEGCLSGLSGVKQYCDDPVLLNRRPYNLGIVTEFDFQKWKVPVRDYLFSMPTTE